MMRLCSIFSQRGRTTARLGWYQKCENNLSAKRVKDPNRQCDGPRMLVICLGIRDVQGGALYRVQSPGQKLRNAVKVLAGIASRMAANKGLSLKRRSATANKFGKGMKSPIRRIPKRSSKNGVAIDNQPIS